MIKVNPGQRRRLTFFNDEGQPAVVIIHKVPDLNCVKPAQKLALKKPQTRLEIARQKHNKRFAGMRLSDNQHTVKIMG